MCQRLIGYPVRLMVVGGVAIFALIVFGFIWYSARLKNQVDHATVSSQEVLNATQALVSKSPAMHDAIGFSPLEHSTVEHWTNRRWRVSGYVDQRPQGGVKMRTLYFAVVQQDGQNWNLEDLQLQSMQFSGTRN